MLVFVWENERTGMRMKSECKSPFISFKVDNPGSRDWLQNKHGRDASRPYLFFITIRMVCRVLCSRRISLAIVTLLIVA
jgi:hypothetical protein